VEVTRQTRLVINITQQSTVVGFDIIAAELAILKLLYHSKKRRDLTDILSLYTGSWSTRSWTIQFSSLSEKRGWVYQAITPTR